MADANQSDAGAAGKAKAPAETTEEKARRWMSENLAGGPLSRNTELWNVVVNALPALAKVIDG